MAMTFELNKNGCEVLIDFHKKLKQEEEVKLKQLQQTNPVGAINLIDEIKYKISYLDMKIKYFEGELINL